MHKNSVSCWRPAEPFPCDFPLLHLQQMSYCESKKWLATVNLQALSVGHHNSGKWAPTLEQPLPVLSVGQDWKHYTSSNCRGYLHFYDVLSDQKRYNNIHFFWEVTLHCSVTVSSTSGSNSLRQSFKTLKTLSPATQCNIPEDLKHLTPLSFSIKAQNIYRTILPS